MEIIIKSSLSRKVLNHCIIEIIKKYSKSIAITQNKDIYKITFVKAENGVSAKDLNILLNFLFSKKDLCNDYVHFDGIEKPKFIDDIWTEVIDFIKLKDENLSNFNKIVTNEIKNSFQFSQKDQSISTFIKSFKK